MHFFFSSRRRHTRWPRDWSSDVCSSDLTAHAFDAGVEGMSRFLHRLWRLVHRVRSEERRVGKEGKFWGMAAPEKIQGEAEYLHFLECAGLLMLVVVDIDHLSDVVFDMDA